MSKKTERITFRAEPAIVEALDERVETDPELVSRTQALRTAIDQFLGLERDDDTDRPTAIPDGGRRQALGAGGRPDRRTGPDGLHLRGVETDVCAYCDREIEQPGQACPASFGGCSVWR